MKTVYVRVGGLSDQLYHDFLKHMSVWETNHQSEKISCLISTKPIIDDALKQASASDRGNCPTPCHNLDLERF